MKHGEEEEPAQDRDSANGSNMGGRVYLRKNILQKLHDLKPGLKYNLESQSSPRDAPVFVMSVEVNGETFVGEGRSKHQAKLNAAKKALASLGMDPGLCWEPTFTMSVELNGETFVGVGKSEHRAKLNAVKRALASLGISIREYTLKSQPGPPAAPWIWAVSVEEGGESCISEGRNKQEASQKTTATVLTSTGMS